MQKETFEEEASLLALKAQEYPSVNVSWCEPFLKIRGASQDIDWEAVVLYHVGYRVPVLYFRPTNCVLDSKSVVESLCKWSSYVSPCELPLTGQPFYMLHPCRSQEVAGCLLPWLSVVLQVIGLTLPLELFI